MYDVLVGILGDSLGFLFLNIHTKNRTLLKERLARYGLSIDEFTFLMLLKRVSNMLKKDLHQYMSSETYDALVISLVEKELINIYDDGQSVALSRLGKLKLKKTLPLAKQCHQSIQELLGHKNYNDLIQILTKIDNRIKIDIINKK